MKSISVSSESFEAIFQNDQRGIVLPMTPAGFGYSFGERVEIVGPSGAKCNRIVCHIAHAPGDVLFLLSLRPMTSTEKMAAA